MSVVFDLQRTSEDFHIPAWLLEHDHLNSKTVPLVSYSNFLCCSQNSPLPKVSKHMSPFSSWSFVTDTKILVIFISFSYATWTGLRFPRSLNADWSFAFTSSAFDTIGAWIDPSKFVDVLMSISALPSNSAVSSRSRPSSRSVQYDPVVAVVSEL